MERYGEMEREKDRERYTEREREREINIMHDDIRSIPNSP